MWDISSHLSHPLTAFTSKKVKFKWTNMEQKEFDEIKRTVTHYTLLAYLDFNRHFYIQTHAINYQLGAVIIHNGKPITFYSRKLTENQK